MEGYHSGPTLSNLHSHWLCFFGCSGCGTPRSMRRESLGVSHQERWAPVDSHPLVGYSSRDLGRLGVKSGYLLVYWRSNV
jgi:hypothetical protein